MDFPEHYTTNALKQGYLGEKYFADWCIANGIEVEFPEDVFSPWDLKIKKDGVVKTVQVKTMSRFVIKNLWKIHCSSDTTFQNIRSNDNLVIITRRPQESSGFKYADEKYAGRVILMPKNHKYSYNKLNYFIPCNQHFIDLFRLSEEQLNSFDQFDY